MAISEDQRVQAMRKGKSSLIFAPPSSVMSLVARRLKVAERSDCVHDVPITMKEPAGQTSLGLSLVKDLEFR